MLGKRIGILLLLVIATCSLAFAGGQRASREAVTIEWWGEFTGFEALGTEEAVRQYNAANPTVQVKHTGQPDLDKKVIAAVMAGNPPAIASVGSNGNFPQLVTGGTYMILDDLIKEVGVDFTDYFQPWTNKAMVFDGKTYGIPYTNWSLMLVYNKDKYREAGLDPEKPPRTIADFEQVQQALTKKDSNGKITQMGLSFRATFPAIFSEYFSYSFGASPETLYDAKNKKFLKSGEIYQTWEWLQSMAKKYGAKEMQQFVGGFGSWGTEAEPFLSGQMAMSWNGPWIADHIRRYAPDMDFGLAAIPSVDKVAAKGRFGLVSVEPYCIPKGAKHAREALEFMKWFAGKEGQMFFNTGKDGSGRCPTVVDYGGQEFIDKCAANPRIGEFIEMFNSPVVQPFPMVCPAAQAYRTEFSAILAPVMTLEVSAREAVDKAIERAQDALDKQKM